MAFGLVGRGGPCALAFVSSSGSDSVVVASLREVAIVLVPGDCPQHIPSRGTAHESRGQLRRAQGPADADLSSANSSPPGPLHPTRRAAGLGHGWPRPPHPGHISSWPKREGSQAAREQLRSDNRAAAWSQQPPLCCVRFDSPFGAPITPLAWAEGRALLRSNPSAVPGAETEWGGTMPPSPIRDRHPGAKPSPRRPLAYSLPHPAPAWLSSPPRRRPGTRRRSAACSACAR